MILSHSSFCVRGTMIPIARAEGLVVVASYLAVVSITVNRRTITGAMLRLLLFRGSTMSGHAELVWYYGME